MFNIAALWDQLVLCICRPPRDEYTPAELVGGTRGNFRVGRFEGVREDVTLTNKHGLKLQCSHFKPRSARGKDGRLPCVIYCHCNSGSRRDAEEALCILLPLGVSVFTVDFAGSGLSEGQWVTLGAHEVNDVEVCVAHLRSSGQVSVIGLWGRSMGAVTALLYSQRDPSIAGIVLDSPFSRLTDLMLEIVEEQKMPIPRAFAKLALSAMKRSVRKRAGFDIGEVAPLDKVSEAFTPALFGHATGDTFVRIHHSEKLHEAYAGDKNLIRFEGDHNSRRPEFFYNSVAIFFHNTLQLDKMLEGGNQLNQELLAAAAVEAGVLAAGGGADGGGSGSTTGAHHHQPGAGGGAPMAPLWPTSRSPSGDGDEEQQRTFNRAGMPGSPTASAARAASSPEQLGGGGLDLWHGGGTGIGSDLFDLSDEELLALQLSQLEAAGLMDAYVNGRSGSNSAASASAAGDTAAGGATTAALGSSPMGSGAAGGAAAAAAGTAAGTGGIVGGGASSSSAGGDNGRGGGNNGGNSNGEGDDDDAAVVAAETALAAHLLASSGRHAGALAHAYHRDLLPASQEDEDAQLAAALALSLIEAEAVQPAGQPVQAAGQAGQAGQAQGGMPQQQQQQMLGTQQQALGTQQQQQQQGTSSSSIAASAALPHTSQQASSQPQALASAPYPYPSSSPPSLPTAPAAAGSMLSTPATPHQPAAPLNQGQHHQLQHQQQQQQLHHHQQQPGNWNHLEHSLI